jgi:glycerol-3-phosphate dehydrogenase
MNDARLNVMLAMTALKHGAAVANKVEVTSLIHEPRAMHPTLPGDGPEVVVGAMLKDSITGEEWSVRAKCVINATGPFAGMFRLELIARRILRVIGLQTVSGLWTILRPRRSFLPVRAPTLSSLDTSGKPYSSGSCLDWDCDEVFAQPGQPWPLGS